MALFHNKSTVTKDVAISQNVTGIDTVENRMV